MRRTDGGQKRRLEPSAVLVGTLEIHIGGVTHALFFENDKVARTRIDPAVERVCLLAEVILAAFRADKAFGKKGRGFKVEPSVRTERSEFIGYGVYGLVVADRLAAVLTIEYGNRKSPLSLAGNAPVGALLNHRNNAFAAPFRDPFHLAAGVDRFVFKCVYRAEPLGRCTENDRVFAAPAVRILVDNFLRREERAAFLHIFEDRLV